MISKLKLRSFIIALGNSANKLKEENLKKTAFLEKCAPSDENTNNQKTESIQKILSEEEMKAEIRKYETEIKRILKDARADLKFYAEHRIESIKIESDLKSVYEKLKKLYDEVANRKAAEEKKIKLERMVLESQRKKKIEEIKEIIKNIELQYSIISRKLNKKQREKIRKRIKKLKSKVDALLKNKR
jgi:hypothetical protein